jgi:hypothetical protein
MMDNRYWGIIQLRKGKWVVLLQNSEDITSDDMDALSEMIEEYELSLNKHF